MGDLTWLQVYNDLLESYTYSLKELVEFYDEKVSERVYEYTTENEEHKQFMIEVYNSHLPHLMGLQHFDNLPTTQPSKQYEELLNGNWSFDYLMKADAGAFKEYKLRIHGIKYLYAMLRYSICEVKLIHQAIETPFKRRNIQLIFTTDYQKFKYILELREMKCASNITTYVPVTLTVYPKKSDILKIKTLPLKIREINYRKK